MPGVIRRNLKAACAIAVALAGGLVFTGGATAHNLDRIISPSGGYLVIHPDFHRTVTIYTQSHHAVATPYAHIVHDTTTGKIWGPWNRSGTGVVTLSSCDWDDNPVRTLHDNQGTGDGLHRSNPMESWCV